MSQSVPGNLHANVGRYDRNAVELAEENAEHMAPERLTMANLMSGNKYD